MLIEPPDFNRNVHCLLGLPFDAINLDSAVIAVQDAIAKRKPLFISTPNLNFLVACKTDAEFRGSVIHSELSQADGMPIVWLAKFMGIPLSERVAGSSLFERLRNTAGISAEAPLRIYFFGGPDGAARQACERINQVVNDEMPHQMICVGYASPGFGSVEDMSTESILQNINASKADFVVVSLGARKGQAWIERNRNKLAAPVISHLGAVVNMVAGTVVRAPAWMQRTGLEWIWRIREEPELWRRYWGDGLALLRLMLTRVLPYLWYLKFNRSEANETEATDLSIETYGTVMKMVFRGSWTTLYLEPLRRAFRVGIDGGYNIELHLGAVTFVDSAFWGQLLLLHGYQERTGRTFRIVEASKEIQQLAYFSCVEFLLSKAK